MSRSYKKVAGGGVTTARSDKEYKTSEHRRYRAVIRSLIVSGEEDLFPRYKGKYGNTWSAPKDGKCVWYWSLHSFLKTTVLVRTRRSANQRYVKNERLVWYWFSSHYYVERPATIGDWKKDWIGK